MTIKLEAKTRKVAGKKVFSLRSESKIPGVLYGPETENQNLEIDYVKFEKIYTQAGGNTIVDLSVDGQETGKVLIQDVSYDSVGNRIAHFDLRKINMKEKITAEVELHFTGESKAVKEEGGILVHALSQVTIKCLPDKLVHEIAVDVSGLNTFDDVIKISDLKLPEGVEVVEHEAEDVVATVARPKVEEEIPVAAPAEEGEKSEEAKTESDAEKKAE